MYRKQRVMLSKALLALLLVSSFIAKVIELPEIHHGFNIFGLPSWLSYLIGAVQITIAIMLFIPALSTIALVISSIILIGSIYHHSGQMPSIEVSKAVVGLSLCFYIFRAR